ncbi:hypothetical protein Tco_1346675 [Tanacetum coccineum]
MVKTSFQKLKNHFASFNKVVKVRTTLDAVTEGSWGFEHTKAVFKQEVIPFIKTLRDLFKDFNNGLNLDLNEKELCEHDRLLQLSLCQDVTNIIMHADSISGNVLSANNECLVNANFIDEYNETLVLKAELAKKEHMVEKNVYNEVLLRCSRLKNQCASLEIKLQHQKESFQNNNPLNTQNAPTLLEFFEINNLQSKLEAKDVSITNMRKRIADLKAKSVLTESSNYIKHAQKHADNLREIVERARALKPLDSDLDYACKYATRIQEVLVYVHATCPSLAKPSEKLVAVTPLNKNKNKKVRLVPLCFAIFDLEPLSLSFNFSFAAALAVLITGASQSRQHGKSESDSYYLSD